MSTYTQIIYQIVFGTKYRRPCLVKEGREELFKYMSGVIMNKQCFLYCMNGVEDHVHIVISLHPSIALASLVKDIKVSSTLYIKEKKLFKDFSSWQSGYGAFTYTVKEKDRLIAYVKRQEEHHRKKTFLQEYEELLREHSILYDEKYLL
jgi:putative transposase